MKKLLLSLSILSSGYIAIADPNPNPNPIENCSYNESKIILEIVKKTVGSLLISHANAIREGVIQKKLCSKHIKESGLSEQDVAVLINNGINRAWADSMGDSPSFGMAKEINEQNWQQIAIENLVFTIRNSFSDSSITLVDPGTLIPKVESNQPGPSGVSIGTRALSGPVKLSNEYSCNAVSQVFQPSSPDSSQRCIVKFSCNKGSQINFQEIQKDCSSFAESR